MTQGEIVTDQRFDPISVTAHPPYNGSSHDDASSIRQRDGHWEGLPNLQRQITGETPSVQRDIPDCAMPLGQPRVIGHRATDRAATIGSNREGHEGESRKEGLLRGCQFETQGATLLSIRLR